MNEADQQIFNVLARSDLPLTVAEVSRALGRTGWSSVENTRAILNRLAAKGILAKAGHYRKTYQVVVQVGKAEFDLSTTPAAVTEERFAVDVPRLGHEGVTDPDVLDEIEAEKVWTCAAVLRAANTAWGIDMGIDADVREARAIMAEARRQVRDRSPIGNHYFEGEPAAEQPI